MIVGENIKVHSSGLLNSKPVIIQISETFVSRYWLSRQMKVIATKRIFLEKLPIPYYYSK
jgi:hypothetical protein